MERRKKRKEKGRKGMRKAVREIRADRRTGLLLNGLSVEDCERVP